MPDLNTFVVGKQRCAVTLGTRAPASSRDRAYDDSTPGPSPLVQGTRQGHREASAVERRLYYFISMLCPQGHKAG